MQELHKVIEEMLQGMTWKVWKAPDAFWLLLQLKILPLQVSVLMTPNLHISQHHQLEKYRTACYHSLTGIFRREEKESVRS